MVKYKYEFKGNYRIGSWCNNNTLTKAMYVASEWAEDGNIRAFMDYLHAISL